MACLRLFSLTFAGKRGSFALSALQRKISSPIFISFSGFQPLHETTGFFNSLLGLFDRPADEKAICALLKSPAIPGLTESLTDLSPSEWRTVLARLRRARLLTGE